MFRRSIAIVTLISFILAECGCYRIRQYPPQQVKPDWEIAGVVLASGRTVTFDEPAALKDSTIVGSVRDEVGTLHTQKFPLKNVCSLQIRKLDSSVTFWVALGVGVGLGTYFLISLVKSNAAKGNGTDGSDGGGGG